MGTVGTLYLIPLARNARVTFSATLNRGTLASKAFTQVGATAAVKAAVAKRSKDGVFSVENSLSITKCGRYGADFATLFSMTKPFPRRKYALDFVSSLTRTLKFDVLN